MPSHQAWSEEVHLFGLIQKQNSSTNVVTPLFKKSTSHSSVAIPVALFTKIRKYNLNFFTYD
jgi:hypothetical protein